MIENIAVQKVKNLAAEARQWVQRWLGRELADEEEVTIMVFPPHPASEAAKRQAALVRMMQFFDRTAVNMKDIPYEEFEAAVDEAMDHIRRREP